MITVPKSLSIHIGIFGRTNVGKSTLINYISGQQTSIVSQIAGTTTDVVYKTMELLPLGPVTLIDTAGLDDQSSLSAQRLEKTMRAFDMTDIAILVVEPGQWTDYEYNIINILKKKKIEFVVLVNNYRNTVSDNSFKNIIEQYDFFESSLSDNHEYRDHFLTLLKNKLFNICPESLLNSSVLTDNLVKRYQTVVMVVPIDLGAPKGRLILPQVQMIRSVLDINAMVYIAKDTELQKCLDTLKNKPDLVICDSQVVKKVADIVPEDVNLTTFSIIFSFNRADVNIMKKGIEKLKNLRQTDKILIAEACTHHASKDDIGRVKIPALIKKYFGFDMQFDFCSGIDFPKNIHEYALIIHCGGCMINKKQMFSRLNFAADNGIAITNYGMVISFCQGVLERVTTPFFK